MKVIEHNYALNGKLSKRAITTEIILHCSATAEGKDYDVDTIDGWHKNNGWTCIGYHFVIYRDGSIHRGRPVWASGAHTTNHNGKAIGICYIGGCKKDGLTPDDTRTEAQKEAMYELVELLLENYHLQLKDVHGHYEFANKACPSFKMTDFRKEFESWKNKDDAPKVEEKPKEEVKKEVSKPKSFGCWLKGWF